MIRKKNIYYFRLIHFIDKSTEILCFLSYSIAVNLKYIFGLKILYDLKINDFETDHKDLYFPRLITRKLYSILLIRGMLGSNTLLSKQAINTMQEFTKFITNSTEKVGALPLKEWNYNNDPIEMLDKFVNNHIPFKITGYKFNPSELDINSLIKNHGKKNVLFTDKFGATFEDKFNRIIKTINGSEQLYISNCGRILNEKDFNHSLSINVLSKLLNWSNRDLFQLFVGGFKNSGTPFHCAATSTIFFQIQGKKKWILIDPKYFLMLYPSFASKNQFQGSILPHPILENDYFKYPLYFHCPRHETILNQGEILVNPRWFYHSVENITKISIGVSSRWERNKILKKKETNHLFNLLTYSPLSIVNHLEYLFRRNSKYESNKPNLSRSINNLIFEKLSHDKNQKNREYFSTHGWGIDPNK
jgi:hypothetical protein